MFFSRKPVKPSEEASNIAEKLSVLESIYETQAVAEFSTEGTVLTANSLYHGLFGCDDGSLINRPHKELCHQKDVNSPEYAAFWQNWRLAHWLTASSEGKKRTVIPSG